VSKSLIAVSRVTPVGQQKNIYFETSKIGLRTCGADREGVDPPAGAIFTAGPHLRDPQTAQHQKHIPQGIN
jgi:hypothetical protein